MAKQVNYPVLKAYLLKLFNLFEFAYDYYFRNVNIVYSKTPKYAISFLFQLKELKNDWHILLNKNLANVIVQEMDLSQLNVLFLEKTPKLWSIENLLNDIIIYQYLSYSPKKEFEPYYNLQIKLSICCDLEDKVLEYIQKKPITDNSAQTRKVKAIYDVELKTKPIVLSKSVSSESKETDEYRGRLAAVIIVGLILVTIPAYLLAAFSVGDTSEDFYTWFAISYVILAITLIPLGCFSPIYGDGETYSSGRGGRSISYSFWSVPRGRSLTTGWKIKKYNPEGWRRKNGTNLFKQSGRKSKKWF